MLLYNALLVISFAVVDKFVIMCIIHLNFHKKVSVLYLRCYSVQNLSK